MDSPHPTEADDPLSPTFSDQAQFHTMLVNLLGWVCSSTPWEYGESWIPQSNNVLELSSAWFLDSALDSFRATAWTQFQMCSKSCVLRPGEGMPGRVWQTHQPDWIADTSAQSEAYFLRNQIAKAFGVKAGLGMPLVVNNEIVAVVAFFMSEVRPKDAALIEQTQAAIANFGNSFSPTQALS
jgi:hypothetical protein